MEIRLGDPTKPFLFPPADSCIYCGAKKDNNVLSKEHIFPLGLGGNIVLPAASCEQCSKITSDIERKLLRGPFWPVRVKLGVHSGRRPGQQPTDFDIEFWKGHERKRFLQNLSAKDEPVFLMMPGFHAPTALTGETFDNENGFYQIFVNLFGGNSIVTDLDSMISTARADGIGLGSVTDPILVRRFVAKILHGLACADFPGTFRPFLNELILGKNLENAGHLVGSHQGDIEMGSAMHSIGLGFHNSNGKTILIGGVSLFSQQTKHLYIAAIGEMIE